MRLPEPLSKLIEQFTILPGIGPRTAERLVFWLLKRSPETITNFAQVLTRAAHEILFCPTCHNLTDRTHEQCIICADTKRNHALVCVVADIPDLYALEKTSSYEGVYHVLGGVLNPLMGITPDKLTIRHLQERLTDLKVTELIFALNPDTEGEITATYVQKFVERNGLTITRLARGLPPRVGYRLCR